MTDDIFRLDVNEHKMVDSFIRFNIGGGSYRIRSETLKIRCESSLLARFAQLQHYERLTVADAYLTETNEYYFERPARLFEPIFDFYSTGNLHRPPQICMTQMLAELDYWQVPRTYFSPCCASADTLSPTSPSWSPEVHSIENTTVFDQSETNGKESNEFEHLCFGSQRQKAWAFFEDPSSSFGAKVFTMLSIFFVVTSVSGLIFGSLPELQTYNNHTDEMEPHATFQYAEYVCISWFSLEYLSRLLVAPRKLEFIKAPLNIIDLLTILPFFVEHFLQVVNFGSGKLKRLTGLMLVIRILRVLRVARVFKLARYSSGLKSFGATVQHSLQELSMLGLFLVTAIIFFSTVVYFLEKDEPETKFISIPAACWWCIVTMTTVGYGDIVPQTVGGKLIASVASISGVLVLAFPITMIVDNFSRHHERTGDAKGTQHRGRRRFGKFV